MQVHRNTCKVIGQHSRHPCGSPNDCHTKLWIPYIGKFTSIFHAEGRDGEWDKKLGLGNPAVDKSLNDYLRVVSGEQL